MVTFVCYCPEPDCYKVKVVGDPLGWRKSEDAHQKAKESKVRSIDLLCPDHREKEVKE